MLWIASDGTLTPVTGSPFSSGGILPISIAVHENLVYVANGGIGSSNYTGFMLGNDGSLSPIAGSTFPLAALDLRVDRSGRTLYVVEDAAKAVAALAVNPGGTLTELAGSPFVLPATSSFPFGVAIN